jgi:hypothetical protein
MEDVMKANRILAGTMTWLLAAATPVLAAGAVREDHSGLVVWVFLGFCALIVVAQLLPAVLMLTGMIKGVLESKEEATEEATK